MKRNNLNDSQERIARSIVHAVINAQSKCACWLQNKTEQLSPRVKRMVALFAFFSGGLYSFYLLITGFTTSSAPVIKIQAIKTPAHITTEQLPENKIPVTELKQIGRFRQYIDSLQDSKSGKYIADSLLSSRPGLLDSIEQLEKMYHK